MLNLERLGNITTELSQSLVKSIVLPSGWLQRLKGGGDRPGTAELKGDPAGQIDLAIRGLVILSGTCPVPDEAVVAIIHHGGGRNQKVRLILAGIDEAQACVAPSVRAFSRYGIKDIAVLEVTSREQAEDSAVCEQIAGADVVLIVGEDGRRAAGVLMGTPAHDALRRLLEAGKVVMGAAGGAAVLAERMMAPDESGAGSVMEPGLALLPRLVLACGFDDRQGHSRLLHAVGCQLGARYLGIWLDQRTAVAIHGIESRVLGEGAVTFMDGREVSAVPEETLEQSQRQAMADALPVCGLKVHVLVSGYGLNLRTRKPMGPPRPAAQAAGG